MSAHKYPHEICLLYTLNIFPNVSRKLPSEYTCDPLNSRAAFHTALWCKYTQLCSFARLCSENGGLARPRLRLIFTDTFATDTLRPHWSCYILFVWITIVYASQKECNLKPNLIVCWTVYHLPGCVFPTWLCAIWPDSALGLSPSGNPYSTNTSHSLNMSRCWQRSMIPMESRGDNGFRSPSIINRCKSDTGSVPCWPRCIEAVLKQGNTHRCAPPGPHFGKNAQSNFIARLYQVTQSDYASVVVTITASFGPGRRPVTVRKSNSRCQTSKPCRYRPPSCRLWARLCVSTLQGCVRSFPAV